MAPVTYMLEVEGQGQLKLRRSQLVVEKGSNKKAVCELIGERATVGTAEGNDLVLTDTSVSRLHFAVEAHPEGFVLRDLASTNGTIVDGLRVREVYLRDGSRVSIGRSRLRFELLRGETDIELEKEDRFDQLVGRSSAMRRLFAILRRVSDSDASALLLGESGTGKELVARALHRGSARLKGPFVVIDCGALPEALVESELFGHVRGSFTGAIADRQGAFEQANGGTLFLDEIGELPLEMQPKLLRALEAREVRPVGSNELRRVDVRVVAATSRDLRLEVNRNAFRTDLYFRLAVVVVELPPLRERLEDIPLLVKHFLDQAAARRGAAVSPLPMELMARFRRRQWPGNVRELRNEVERFLALGADPEELESEDDAVVVALPPSLSAAAQTVPAPATVDLHLPYKLAKRMWLEPFEREYLRLLIVRTEGNLTAAAREAGIDRNYLAGLLRRYSLR